jgi:hypothetical protein
MSGTSSPLPQTVNPAFRRCKQAASCAGRLNTQQQLAGYELGRVLPIGTVASTDNRNWELLPNRNMPSTPERRFSQSRAVDLLRQERPGQLHSRKLRSFAEVTFQ